MHIRDISHSHYPGAILVSPEELGPTGKLTMQKTALNTATVEVLIGGQGEGEIRGRRGDAMPRERD